MRWFWGLALAVAAMPAQAALYEVRVNGTLTAQASGGTDPALGVGDAVEVTARFDSSRMVQWGSHGYQIAGLYGLPTSGDEYFKVSAGGLGWASQDEELDGFPFFTRDTLVETGGGFDSHSSILGLPAIILSGDKVVGLAGFLIPANTSAVPSLDLGSLAGSGNELLIRYLDGTSDVIPDFTAASLSDAFRIRAGGGLYGNVAQTPGFDGRWDFASSSLSVVPEPASWLTILAGFGIVGGAMRRRTSKIPTRLH